MIKVLINNINYYIIKYNCHEKILFEPEDVYGDWALLPLLDRSPKRYCFWSAVKYIFPPELNDGQDYYLVTYEKPTWFPFNFTIEAINELNKLFYKIIDNDSSKI